jgi:hypothetical protein
MRVLMWHVHGSYTTSFVQGDHEVLLPRLPDRGPDGHGRAETWDWPPNAIEITPAEAADADVDVVVLQRPAELEFLAEQWLGGRRPGRDIPAVYLEHNCPQGLVNEMRHPAADRTDLTVVHVTHFNARFWDTGRTPTRVISHGVVDPGPRFTGALPRAAAVINEPARRARVTGTDLLPRFAGVAPLDLYGMKVADAVEPLRRAGVDITACGDVPQHRMHGELARHRVYVHPFRWTSLGLSLIEAMLLGMPVVALATTEVAETVPPEVGAVSNDLEVLEEAVRRLVNDPDLGRACGQRARAIALERFGLARFLDDWDALLKEVCA